MNIGGLLGGLFNVPCLTQAQAAHDTISESDTAIASSKYINVCRRPRKGIKCIPCILTFKQFSLRRGTHNRLGVQPIHSHSSSKGLIDIFGIFVHFLGAYACEKSNEISHIILFVSSSWEEVGTCLKVAIKAKLYFW